MKKISILASLGIALLVLAGCETTTSRPYSVSTENVLTIQKTLSDKDSVQLGEFIQAEKAGSLACRLMGPVDVSPGKTQAKYIEEAFRSELFTAQVYDVKADTVISGKLNSFSFSSMSPANWTLNFTVSSNNSDGYTVETEYPFKTSFSAYGACKNVADAFAPAVQKLLSDIVNHPEFSKL